MRTRRSFHHRDSRHGEPTLHSDLCYRCGQRFPLHHSTSLASSPVASMFRVLVSQVLAFSFRYSPSSMDRTYNETSADSRTGLLACDAFDAARWLSEPECAREEFWRLALIFLVPLVFGGNLTLAGHVLNISLRLIKQTHVSLGYMTLVLILAHAILLGVSKPSIPFTDRIWLFGFIVRHPNA